MDIISKSKVIKRIQLRKCIELLGTEYTSLPYKIHVYKDINELKSERENSPNMAEEAYDYILGNPEFAPPGVCLNESKQIKLFPFNQKESVYPILYIVAFAYHEVRHAWQYQNMLFGDETESIPLGKEYLNYFKKPSEIDAYRFAEEQMNLHMLKIKEITELPKHIEFDFKFDVQTQIHLAKQRKR